MKNISLYEKFKKDPDNLRLLKQEELILDITEYICEIMEKENVCRTELAKKMGKSKGFITQILNGGRNLTLRTLSDIMLALGYTIEIAPSKISEEKDAEVVVSHPEFKLVQKSLQTTWTIDFIDELWQRIWPSRSASITTSKKARGIYVTHEVTSHGYRQRKSSH